MSRQRFGAACLALPRLCTIGVALSHVSPIIVGTKVTFYRILKTCTLRVLHSLRPTPASRCAQW